MLLSILTSILLVDALAKKLFEKNNNKKKNNFDKIFHYLFIEGESN